MTYLPIATSILIASLAGGVWAADVSKTTAPDNSAVNVRDAKGGSSTPLDQSNAAADLKLAQSLRRALTAENSLSVNAKNVKIIAAGGVVTLRGPVETSAEREWIYAKAVQLAGSGNVVNQLEVANPERNNP